MKATQISWLLTAAISITMIGCGQGQDPGKNYSQVKTGATLNANQPVPQAPTLPPAPPAPDNSQGVCTSPFLLSIDKDQGNLLITFDENKSSTYQIKVRSLMGADFKIDTENLAPGLSADFHAGRATLTQISKTGVSATYNFTWTPGKARSNEDIQSMTLRYTSSAAARCGADINQTINLIVKPAAQTSEDGSAIPTTSKTTTAKKTKTSSIDSNEGAS